MTGEQPILPAPAAEAERVPFWGYGDVFLVAGLALPCMFLGMALVWLVMRLTHLHPASGLKEVSGMLLGYILLFSALKVIFRVQYGRPFWRSLGWTATRLPVIWCVICGFATTIMMVVAARLIHAPPTTGPLIEMLRDRSTLIVLAIFGTTAAPLFEELAFRGFLQPLLVRSLGAIGGVALTAALFGGLHYSEYGDSWRSALLVALAGAAFGWMRQATGSTAAAAIMHASFNGLQFMAIFAPGNSGLH